MERKLKNIFKKRIFHTYISLFKCIRKIHFFIFFSEHIFNYKLWKLRESGCRFKYDDAAVLLVAWLFTTAGHDRDHNFLGSGERLQQVSEDHRATIVRCSSRHQGNHERIRQGHEERKTHLFSSLVDHVPATSRKTARRVLPTTHWQHVQCRLQHSHAGPVLRSSEPVRVVCHSWQSHQDVRVGYMDRWWKSIFSDAEKPLRQEERHVRWHRTRGVRKRELLQCWKIIVISNDFLAQNFCDGTVDSRNLS